MATALNRSTSLRALAHSLLVICGIALSGCTTTTLFRSQFNTTAIGQPPAVTQAVGTAHTDGPAIGVQVVAAPVEPVSLRWIRIERPNDPGVVVGLQGKLSSAPGPGFYVFSATMFMPSGAGVATVQFETTTNPPSSLQSFMHLDLTTDNQVRINDEPATAFGTFTRDKPFIIQVTLNITATATTGNIALAGDGASGTRDFAVTGVLQNFSRNFGALRIWQGFPHTGGFMATSILVTRRND